MARSPEGSGEEDNGGRHRKHGKKEHKKEKKRKVCVGLFPRFLALGAAAAGSL